MSRKEIVRKWFDHLDNGQLDQISNLMSESHAFHTTMSPAALSADHHLGMMQQMTSSFSGKHLLDIVLEDGNFIVVKGRWKGKHVGEFNGIPPTNKKVEFSWIDIFEIIDGQVHNEYFEMNPMLIMEQIGSSKESVS